MQNFGSVSEVLIRLPPADDVAAGDPAAVTAMQNRVLDVLRAQDQDVTIRRLESVGSQVGEDLFENAGLALLFALILVFVYVMVRFRWKLAVGAIVATVHDVLVTTGIFALAGWQFDLTVLGSILAVLGYSINDTIVVYDRIRDNFRLMRRGTPEADRQRVRESDARAHVGDGRHELARAVRVDVPRRRHALGLLRGAHHRHPRRHLLVDLRRELDGAGARGFARPISSSRSKKRSTSCLRLG